MGYHCWLCGKNSNSKKQWQQHIQSEKHKEKVFTSDSDASGWAYRFPMGEFRLCDRCAGGRGQADGQRAWGDEVVAPSGSSWPGGGAQLLLGVRSRGRGGTRPGPSLAALGQVLERVGTCLLSAGLKLQGETCGGRLSGQGLARGAAARVGRAQGSGSEPPAALHRLQKGKACPDGDKCRCAHGQEELNEWLDRREVLKQKLAKARKDMLLCPRDDDFGKYNFLLQEDGDAAGAAPEAPAAAPATVTGE